LLLASWLALRTLRALFAWLALGRTFLASLRLLALRALLSRLAWLAALFVSLFAGLLLSRFARLAFFTAVAGLIAARLACLAIGLLLVAGLRACFAFALLLRAAGAFVGRFMFAGATLAGGVGLLPSAFLAAARLIAAGASLRIALLLVGRAGRRFFVVVAGAIVLLVLFLPLAHGVVVAWRSLLLASAVTGAGIAVVLIHRAVGRSLFALLLVFCLAVAWLRFAGLAGAFALAWILASRAALLLVTGLLAGALRLRAFGLRLLTRALLALSGRVV
jgi:hypothetical protein